MIADRAASCRAEAEPGVRVSAEVETHHIIDFGRDDPAIQTIGQLLAVSIPDDNGVMPLAVLELPMGMECVERGIQTCTVQDDLAVVLGRLAAVVIGVEGDPERPCNQRSQAITSRLGGQALDSVVFLQLHPFLSPYALLGLYGGEVDAGGQVADICMTVPKIKGDGLPANGVSVPHGIRVAGQPFQD